MEEPPLRVGYTLAPKKQQSFIRPSLLTLAISSKSTTSLPLIQQGPFDCVLHKINGHDWISQLQDYSARNPKSLLIDSPAEILRLHNRVSMLQAVHELRAEEVTRGTDEDLTRGTDEEVTRGKEEKDESSGVPRQSVIYDHQTLVDRRSD